MRYWLVAQYRANPPTLSGLPKPRLVNQADIDMAFDSPAADFIKELRNLGNRWLKAFNTAAKEIGEWFANKTFSRADKSFETILKDAGWTVKFRNTRTVQEVMRATIEQQVGLIRSIGQQHLAEVQGMVMRSVQMGGDLALLTDQLEKRYQLTRSRAALIARDQNKKATASITRVRQEEIGITKAIWVHSNAGKTKRPLHVAFAAGREGGPVYDVVKGAQIADDGGWTWPGYEINCRCISRPILPAV